MLDRIVAGEVPKKHHIALRSAKGELRNEECLTRVGFDGPYSILYHVNRPHAQTPAELDGLDAARVEAAPERPLRKRHYQSQHLSKKGGPAISARVPLLFNDDVVLSVLHPSTPDPAYFSNGDADDLYFIFEGTGVLRSIFGDLRYEPNDYVCIPRGVTHRFVPDAGVAQYWLSMECTEGLGLLKQWRNDVGQLRMDAPYCHRDFRTPTFAGPVDEKIRKTIVKRQGAHHAFTHDHSPLDVVGWDGAVYPWIFPILNFQPRAGLTHLPPTWHGTFSSRGTLICSFVPRVVDFHPDAIPCPYPHASVHCDEFLFYCRGNFTSRKGVGPGSISHHPMGIPHGPHPGSYEASIGTTRTDELAVMLDTFKPLTPTPNALAIEDPDYQQSFI